MVWFCLGMCLCLSVSVYVSFVSLAVPHTLEADLKVRRGRDSQELLDYPLAPELEFISGNL